MMDHLHLLLAHAQTGRPVLKRGLPHASLEHASRPARGPRSADAFIRDAPDKNPNDLKHQRWGVIAPAGTTGDLVLDAMAPLIRQREHEQGAQARIYRVAPGMNARDAVRWRDDIYRAEHVPESERPRYLMMLGDLHHVSLDLQQVMAHSAFVGRVDVGDASGEPDADGYAAYAAKSVAHARAAKDPEPAPQLLLYTARDGTMATTIARSQLVGPCTARLEARAVNDPSMRDMVFTISNDTRDRSGTSGLLAAADTARPAVLLSVSHGQGAPPEGWGSAARQRAEQGALVLGPAGRDAQLLDAETVRSRRFLPGGMWFCLACFGAGTPQTSSFQAWLSLLVDQGMPRDILAPVLASLPCADDPRPFIAAMPQAALANPHGPLAIIGHVDLAWAYSFSDPRCMANRVPSRILSVLDAWLRRARAGVALDALMRFYREANDALMLAYQDQEDARINGQPDPTNFMERGKLWMLRNDLRGYVLLGDPAARL